MSTDLYHYASAWGILVYGPPDWADLYHLWRLDGLRYTSLCGQELPGDCNRDLRWVSGQQTDWPYCAACEKAAFEAMRKGGDTQ